MEQHVPDDLLLQQFLAEYQQTQRAPGVQLMAQEVHCFPVFNITQQLAVCTFGMDPIEVSQLNSQNREDLL